MSHTAHQGLEAFVEAWIPEFGKSVEKVTGATATADLQATDAQASDALQWQRHTFSREQSGALWVGVTPDTITTLSTTAETPDQKREAYLELMSAALEGAAQVLSATHTGLVHGDESEAAPPPPTATAMTIWFVIGEQRIAVELRADDAFGALLSASAPTADAAPAAADSADSATKSLAGTASSRSSALDRFAGLNLPLAIVLGRATVPIRDVLQLTVGSMIELDKHASDPVDVCVHNVVVARGEVVSIRGNYGVRIQEVLTRELRRHDDHAPISRARAH